MSKPNTIDPAAPSETDLDEWERGTREWIELGNNSPEGLCTTRDVLALVLELRRMKHALQQAGEQLVKYDDEKIRGIVPVPLKDGEAYVRAMRMRLRLVVASIDLGPEIPFPGGLTEQELENAWRAGTLGEYRRRPHREATIKGLVLGD